MSLRLALALALFNGRVQGLTVDEQTMEISASEASPCVRLYNNGDEGWVGCSTPRDGVTLDIMNFDPSNPSQSVSDLKSAGGSRAILIPQNLFTTEWLNKLEATGNLGGVMVYDKAPPAGFSPARASTFNTYGNGFNFKQFSYPIVMLSGDKKDKLLEFAKKNKAAADSTMILPTYKAKFNFYMGPTTEKITSTQCLLWKDLFGDVRPQCQALGGLSVWATTEPIDKPGAAKKVVMATSGIDAASIFHDLAPGADAAASSVVAILAAADAIQTWRNKDRNANKIKNVIGYSLFQGEAWDSIGSRRFVYDIARYQDAASCNNTVKAGESPTGRTMCLDPLLPSVAFQKLGGTLENLEAVVAVDQVGRGSGEVYFHTTEQAVPVISGASKASGAKMPPSPLDSFRLRKPDLAGYVLSGYNSNYSNPYYRSQYDNFTTAGDRAAAVSNIVKATKTLASTLVWLANEKVGIPPVIEVNKYLVGNLTECIIGNWRCKLFDQYLQSTYDNLNNYLGSSDLRFYASVPDESWKPSLYTSVASINKIPPTLPYITLTVDDINNFVFSLPKCAKGEKNNKPNKELCMLCDSADSADCNLQSKEALMQNIHVVTYPKNVYEGFLKSFLAATTTITNMANATTLKCNTTADCTTDKAIATAGKITGKDYECYSKKCVLTSAYYHTAISPAIDPTPNGEIYNLNEDLCSGPYSWVCPAGKEMLWTEPTWSETIGVEVYPDGGSAVAWIAFFVGLVVAVVGFYAARSTLAGLQKQKLL